MFTYIPRASITDDREDIYSFPICRSPHPQRDLNTYPQGLLTFLSPPHRSDPVTYLSSHRYPTKNLPSAYRIKVLSLVFKTFLVKLLSQLRLSLLLSAYTHLLSLCFILSPPPLLKPRLPSGSSQNPTVLPYRLSGPTANNASALLCACSPRHQLTSGTEDQICI